MLIPWIFRRSIGKLTRNFSFPPPHFGAYEMTVARPDPELHLLVRKPVLWCAQDPELVMLPGLNSSAFTGGDRGHIWVC